MENNKYIYNFKVFENKVLFSQKEPKNKKRQARGYEENRKEMFFSDWNDKFQEVMDFMVGTAKITQEAQRILFYKLNNNRQQVQN